MLMIKPSTDQVLSSFVPSCLQIEDMQTTLDFVYGKDLPHQFCFYDEDGPVLLVGMLEIYHNIYDTYTVFSDNWKALYFKPVTRFFKGYIKNINYDMIFHVVSNDRPWTHKMIKLFGFKECQDIGDHMVYSVGEV
jgi:hypothetical protein